MTTNMSGNYAAETASAEGHIAATVIYPDGNKNCQQLPLMDDDGDDVPISNIKKKLFEDNNLHNYKPENYHLVLVKDEGRFVAQDSEVITDYFDQISRDRYIITFEERI